jgi:hypothetical protein
MANEAVTYMDGKIIVQGVGNEFEASFDDRGNARERGKTPSEAIGRLVVLHAADSTPVPASTKYPYVLPGQKWHFDRTSTPNGFIGLRSIPRVGDKVVIDGVEMEISMVRDYPGVDDRQVIFLK